MIFILHYILFNAGLSTTLVLLTLFLQTYSKASLSEIGTLLMVLPFLSIFMKPLFCALADKHQAHKHYLMAALAIMCLGYGSLIWAPFYPDTIRERPQLVWYLDVLGILVGYCAFGVVWSLGDALAVNGAQMNGVSWGSYRVWAVVSWGGFGVLIGQINESVPFLPKYVPAFFVLIISLLLEIVLLALWPNRHFVMGGSLQDGDQQQQQQANGCNGKTEAGDPEGKPRWLRRGGGGGGIAGDSLRNGSVRSNPRLVGKVASLLMEDLGGSLRSSLRLGADADPAKTKPVALADLLDEHQHSKRGSLVGRGAPAGGRVSGGDPSVGGPHSWMSASVAAQLRRQEFAKSREQRPARAGTTRSPAHPAAGGRQWRSRTQRALSRMNTLGASSGHVVVDGLEVVAARWQSMAAPCGAGDQSQWSGLPDSSELAESRASAPDKDPQAMYMSSLASNSSLTRAAAAAAQALGPDGSCCTTEGSLATSCPPRDSKEASVGQQLDEAALPVEPLALASDKQQQQREQLVEEARQEQEEEEQRQQGLQLVLLKLIIRRHPEIRKYLVMFSLFGLLLIVHLSYFFLHLEQLCRQHGVEFSTVMGGMLACHSISEVISFTLVVPHLVPKMGRSGALMTCALIYALRFIYYGTYYPSMSPFYGIPFELCHGIAYGIIYSLITDIASECVDQVDEHLAELLERGLISETTDPAQLKLPLRATMQGVFSGAFDGLGNGIGALFGGLFLDAYSFPQLWRCSAYICLAIMVVYPLSEWRTNSSEAKRAAPSAKTVLHLDALASGEKAPNGEGPV